MANIVKFDDAKKPVSRANSPFKVSLDLMAAGGASYPVISIKGKVFHVKRGEESTLITKPGDDAPASSIELVILGVAPAGKGLTAKTFYADGYVEGSAAKPTCYSNDGVAPGADAAEAQAAKCALCAQNQLGSGATQQNAKAKACKSSKLLAVAAVDNLNDPMLLRVPGASLQPLGEFNKLVASRGYAYQEVLTKIGFDYSVAHPALTFKPIGVLDEATVLMVAEACELDVAKQILDLADATSADEEFAPVKPKLEAPKAEPKKPAARPAPAADDDDLPPPKASVKVEDDEKPKAAPKAKPAAKVVEGDDLDSALDALDFDDE